MSSHHDHDHSGHGHDGHNHDHNHDHDHDHGHDHSDEVSPALQTLIWKQIDFDKIRTLNESEADAGRAIVEKSWQNRLDPTPVLASDADEQILMFVPFAGVIKLHSILLRTSDTASSPSTLKLFRNADDLDFASAVDRTPTQTLTVSRTNEVQDLPVRRPLFGNTYSLTLFIEDNHGGGEEDVTRVYWIGFKGEFAELNREPFEVLYEKAANPKDHEMVAGIGERGALPGGRHGM